MSFNRKSYTGIGVALIATSTCALPATAQVTHTVPPTASALAQQNCVDLIIAIQKGNVGEVQVLLDQGTSVECPSGDYGETPLMQAVSGVPSLEIIEILINHGANITPAGTFHGRLPLTLAAQNKNAQNNNLDVVKLLVEHGAGVNANCTEHGHSAYLASEGVGPDHLTPLGAAVEGENLPVIEYLLQHKANVNGRDGSSYTPLLWACAEGNAKVVQMLLRYGADPKLTTDKGQTARSFAAVRDYKDIVTLLDAAEKKTAISNKAAH